VDSQDFLDVLKQGWPGLSSDEYLSIQRFRNLVVDENTRQNLTRLLNPSDFFEGHVLDVKELVSLDWIEGPAMDLGSGVGVPGLLSAILDQRSWVLAESEGRKAAFLSAAAQEMGVSDRVQVFSGRAEAFLKQLCPETAIQSILARAVGPVERIYSWLRDCSTWNNLVLLKGPGWDKEWEEFQSGRYRGELVVFKAHDYEVGQEKKLRKIIRLNRVPRGTKKK
jgi:16S rRNA (guanine527-N7)-methyltransferase